MTVPRTAARQGVLISHGSRSWRFEAGAVVTVGRGRDCDVVLEDPRLSRRQLWIADLDGWVIEDRGSRNGTWVGGRRLGREPVGVRTELFLGGRDGVLLVIEPDSDVVPNAPQTGTITIGRARDNDIVLNDVLVSRHHAVVQAAPTGQRIVDLGSRNRTFVNGVPAVEGQLLAAGDRLTVGGTELRLDGGELRPAAVATRRLLADELGYRLPSGRQLLADVSFDLGAGELVAVIGPSGAGKSTLLRLLTGQLRPSSGSVSYDGYQMYEQLEVVRPIVGVVPQDDVVHRLLTVAQALSYAAQLRLPDDTGRHERRATVEVVLAELGLTEHAHTRIDRLSGGQRKRVSIALELLTSPSLLVLDEPTSGLDPALERTLMESLRALANAGRTVVVVTHSPAHLSRCDKVLLLASGGVLVYAGRPSGVMPHFDATEWADVYRQLMDDPDPIRHPSAASGGRSAVPAVRRDGAAAPPVGWRSQLRQARILAARHATLVAADRGYVLFLLMLPALLATLALVVPGGSGLRSASPGAPGEAGQVLVLLFVGAAFAGGAIAAREVVGERAIVIRERAAGLRPGAYALAKLAVFAMLCAAQSTLLIAGLALVKPMPAHGVLSVASRPELAVAVWCTALASSQLSLLCSALARSAEQVMPLLVVTVMTQLVLCGGLIPVTGRPVVSQLSWLAPSRWGYAAGAATADLRAISPVAPADRFWAHATPWWLLAVGVLIGMTGVFAGLVAISIRRLNRI
jgi:ABC-type multidrug transport system ATPase subunit/pSer/pThr/pTyr-binding forkhead associated (FHA) protein